MDLAGTVQWTRTIGGAGSDLGYDIITTTDGGYAIAGSTNSFGAGGNDCYVVKLDATGNLQWTRTMGGTGDDQAYSIIQTTAGGYAIAGSTNSFGAGADDIYLIILDGSGNSCCSLVSGGTTNTGGTFAAPVGVSGGGASSVIGATSGTGGAVIINCQ